MDLQYFGGNCIRISTKQAEIVLDDTLDKLGLKSITKANDIQLFTQYQEGRSDGGAAIVIDQPGEYEVSAVSMQGIAAQAHMEEEGKQSATMYKLTAGDMRVAIVGHIYPDLSDEQLEALGTVDVLIIPVGNSGYTLDAIGALKVIKKIEPKLVIPTHYADSKVKYEVPQAELSDVLKAMSMEPVDKTPKLKVKSAELPEITQLIVLERQ